jgi:uncharacterized LabA/DUF88 family protein
MEKKRREEKKRKTYKVEDIGNDKIFPGDQAWSPDDFFKVIVFIDNAYLIRLKKHFFAEGFKFSLKFFVDEIARKKGLVVEKIYLYDAPPFQSGNPTKKEKLMKEIYDEFVNRFRKEEIIVREGRTQRLKIDGSFIYRQKGVDMLLGIDAVGILKEFPEIKDVVFLTGDSDFVPVVEKLDSFGIKVFLWTYFDRNRTSPFSRSNHLIKSVFKYVKLTKEDFLNSKLEVLEK